MQVTIQGSPEEIAALVLAVQGRQFEGISMDPEFLAQSICDREQEASGQL